jgi:hypothetical protein
VRAEQIIDIAFPVDGENSFSDDYDNPRSGGTIHEATDIIADKMTPVLAVSDGVINYLPMDEPSYGFMIYLDGDDGYRYSYIHLNNDTPGTDDGMGGPENAYAPGISRGTRVVRGQHIGWVGDSGNAEATVPHLHFELYQNGQPINPYASLLAAKSNEQYDVALEQELATSINDNQSIPLSASETACASNTLIKATEFDTVYYCGQDGGRYAFQNEMSYFSWYKNFDSVTIISKETLASIPLKGIVTYKPGTYLVKLPSIPKVFAIAHGGTLRWVTSPEVAERLYGENWSTHVRDLSESFYSAYEIGENIDW